MNLLKCTKLFVLIYFLFLTTSVFPQGWIIQTTPLKNQVNISKGILITIVFDRPILQSSINSNNILVRGSVWGFYKANFSYENASNTLIIFHEPYFRPGEKINVTLTENIQDQTNAYMDNAVNLFFTAAAEKGTGVFILNSTAIPAGNHAAQMTSGDFDMDGDVDIVVCNRSSFSIDYFKNNGVGNFVKSEINSGFLIPADIVSDDIDNDRDIDFIVCWENGNRIGVFKNQGNGTFVQSSTINTGSRPVALNLSNFDKDGFLDLVVANWNSDQVVVYKNNGTGNFTSLSSLNPGIRPLTFSSGDIDDDGDVDLAIGIDWNPAEVVIYKNNGEGIFTHSQTVLVRDRPYSITSNDFNNNSQLDFAVSNLYDNSLSLMLNNNGTYNSNLINVGGVYARKVINGDFDADGDIDLIVAYSNSNTVSYYQNNGHADFTGSVFNNPFGPEFCIISNDIDNDNDLDLVATNHVSNSLSVWKNNNVPSLNTGVQILGNNIPDNFELSQNYPNPFNPSTTINFKLKNNEFVAIKIYNSMGKEVSDLVNENLSFGEYTIRFDASNFNLSSGVYYYNINAGEFVDTKKMILMK